jgi:hypothetical protein
MIPNPNRHPDSSLTGDANPDCTTTAQLVVTRFTDAVTRGDKALDSVKNIRDMVNTDIAYWRDKCAQNPGPACDCFGKILSMQVDLGYLDEQIVQWGSATGLAQNKITAIDCTSPGWEQRLADAQTAVDGIVSFADLLVRNQGQFEWRWNTFILSCPRPVPDTIPII